MRVELPQLASQSPREIHVSDLPNGDIVGIVRQVGRLGDLVETAWPAVFLISERFHEVLRVTGITGWTVRPVVVEAADAANDHDLYLLRIDGRCGLVIEPPNSIDSYLNGAEWDGSEMFLAASQDAILVARRCADIIRCARLRNAAVRPAGLKPIEAGTVRADAWDRIRPGQVAGSPDAARGDRRGEPSAGLPTSDGARGE